MSEINGQTDDVALLVNWFFCRPFPPYENLKVDMAGGAVGGKEVGSEALSHWSRGVAARTLGVGRLAWTAYFCF